MSFFKTLSVSIPVAKPNLYFYQTHVSICSCDSQSLSVNGSGLVVKRICRSVKNDAQDIPETPHGKVTECQSEKERDCFPIETESAVF